MPVAATVKVAVWPTATLWLAGCVVMESDAIPAPFRETESVEFEALLATTRLPVTLPGVCGANWT